MSSPTAVPNSSLYSLAEARQDLTRLAGQVDFALAQEDNAPSRPVRLWLKAAVGHLTSDNYAHLTAASLVTQLQWCHVQSLAGRGLLARVVSNIERCQATTLLARRQLKSLTDHVNAVQAALENVEEASTESAVDVIDVAQAVDKALDPALDGPERDANINTARETANTAIANLHQLFQNKMAPWFEEAELVAKSLGSKRVDSMLNTIRKSCTNKRAIQASPFRLIVNSLRARLSTISLHTRDASLKREWMAVDRLLGRPVNPRELQFNAAFIAPLLAAAYKIIQIHDAWSRHDETGPGQQDAQEAQALVKQLIDVIDEHSNKERAQFEQHSIGHRAAQRYDLNRNKFIRSANRRAH